MVNSTRRGRGIRPAVYGPLCDGCHEVECRCDEREAIRAEEWGPICYACNGGADDGWENCEFGGSGVYEPGPGDEDSHGCPRLTGTF